MRAEGDGRREKEHRNGGQQRIADDYKKKRLMGDVDEIIENGYRRDDKGAG